MGLSRLSLVEPLGVAGDATAVCPVCGGSGFETDLASRCARPCPHCRPLKTALETSAGVPFRYAKCTLENFQVEFDRTPLRSLVNAVLFCRRYVREYPAVQPPGLLIMGGCGTGKTHLAVGVLKRLTGEKMVTGRFFDAPTLLRSIQDRQRAGDVNEVETLLQATEDCDVLVLDDIGPGLNSEWAREVLGHIISRRYDQDKVLIVTTLHRDEPGEDGFEARVGKRIRSRLYEMCASVVLETDDYRRRNAAASDRMPHA